MRISDWSSDVCSSDLEVVVTAQRREERLKDVPLTVSAMSSEQLTEAGVTNIYDLQSVVSGLSWGGAGNATQTSIRGLSTLVSTNGRSEEHTSELQSLMRISYAVFCLNKKKNRHSKTNEV